MNHAIGKIVFSVSPVSVMKCWVGIGWSFRGTKAELVDYRTFSDRFFSFLFSQSNEMGIHEFCAACAQKAENITSDLGDAARRFGSRLRGRLLLPKNQNQVQQEADEYASRVAAWLDSSEGRCGTLAVERMCNWGLVPPCDGLGAVDSFGNAVFGKYVPTLMAVCVQLDVVANSISPTLQFLETLLHEEIHAYIHQGMGNDPNRGELTWLNELCAVCTANYALKVAVEKQLTGTAQSEALHVLAKIV